MRVVDMVVEVERAVVVVSVSQPVLQVFDPSKLIFSRVLEANPICRDIAIVDTLVNLATVLGAVAERETDDRATPRSSALMIRAVLSS